MNHLTQFLMVDREDRKSASMQDEIVVFLRVQEEAALVRSKERQLFAMLLSLVFAMALLAFAFGDWLLIDFRLFKTSLFIAAALVATALLSAATAVVLQFRVHSYNRYAYRRLAELHGKLIEESVQKSLQ
jgi:hypothetical protein